MGRTAATSTISAVPGSSNGRACSTGTGIVAGTVGLTGGGAEDDGSLLHEDKDVEEIAHEEVLPTQHGGDPMQSTDTSVLASSSMTTTAKKRGKKRPKGEPALEAEASVSTPKKRAPRVPKSPAKRRKVDAPTPVKVEEEDNNLAKETDLPKPPKRRKRNPPIPIKVEEGADSLATTITSGDTPKTPKKRGRPSRMNKDTADTTTPVSSTKPKSTAPVKRRKTVKGGVKGPMETSVDDQPNLVAEAEPISSATVAARKGRVKDTTSSSSPAKRKRRASVDGSPSKKRRYGPVKSEHVEPLSIRPTSFPLLEIPSSNTPSLWASDKTDLMILTSKLNMVTTIFVDQESAIGIAIQDDGEMELTITRDCGSQSTSIVPLNPLDEPEAPESLRSPPKETSSLIDLVDSRPSTPLREPQTPIPHPSNTISSPSDESSGGVNPTPQSSSTQAVEKASPDFSPPGLSHEPPKTCISQVSGVVLQYTSFEDHAPRNTVIPSAPSSPPVVRVSPSPPSLDKPHLTTTFSPSLVAARHQTLFDAKQAHFPFDSNRVPLPSPRPLPPRPRHWDQNWDDFPQGPPGQRPGTPPRHDKHWDSKWDSYPRKTFSQRSGSPVRHHKHWDSKWNKYPQETDSRRPSYTSYEEHSPLPSVAKDPRREPMSDRPTGPDPRRRSPPRRGLPTSSYPVHQDHVMEGKPRVWTSRPSKNGLPSFKKIRSTAGSGSLFPLSTSATQLPSSPLPPGLSISEPRSMQVMPSRLDYTRPDAQPHGRSSLQVPTGDYNHLPSPSPSTSSRHAFYSQPDHPHRRMEASSGTYSERLESYSSKRSSLSVYMNNRLGIKSRWDPTSASKGQAITPSSCRPPGSRPLPQISTPPPAPIIKEEEADVVYPPGLSLNAGTAGGSLRSVSKRSSSPPLHVLSAAPPPGNLLNKSRPSSPDSLYADSPRIRDAKPLDVPLSPSFKDTYMLDEVPFSQEALPPTIAPSTTGSPQQVEKTFNTDPARQEPEVPRSVPREIDDTSEPTLNIPDTLEATGLEISRLTPNDVVLPKQSDSTSLRPDELNVVALVANETERIVISDFPEVQQLTDTDSPVLLFVALPGYGCASLGYFRNLGIASETSTEEGEGKRTVWRIRLRWVADEEYGEVEDRNVAKGCWWSEQGVLRLEDKLVRDQCPGLGIGMRAVERWWCRECGQVNREDGWRWRRCLSEKCKDKQPEFLKALSLDEVRGRNGRTSMARPHEMASIPGIMTTIWEDGTVTYMYPLSSTCLVKHIFTGNYPPLQEDASKLWVGLQGQGVELIRGHDGPYYTCSFGGNSNDWPVTVKEASEVVSDSAVGYGEFSSGMVIQRVEVLAWFIKGSAKFKAHETEAVSQVLRAKDNLVGILSLGCEVEVVFHKCRTVAELPSLEGLLAFRAEDGTEQVTVDAVPSTAKPTSPRKRKVADVSDLSIHMVHGDVLILSGDDFYYSIKRSGGGMLVIASSGV